MKSKLLLLLSCVALLYGAGVTNETVTTNYSSYLSLTNTASFIAFQIVDYGPYHEVDAAKFKSCDDLLILLKVWLLERGPLTVGENSETGRLLKPYFKD